MAYNNYMSDSLLLINTFIAGLAKSDVTLPRFADMLEDAVDDKAQNTETADQVYHRFDKLRRAG